MTTRTFPSRVTGQTSSESFNTPGTKRGSNRVITGRKGMAEGNESASTPRTVTTQWGSSEECGRVYAPGYTGERAKRIADRREDGRD